MELYFSYKDTTTLSLMLVTSFLKRDETESEAKSELHT